MAKALDKGKTLVYNGIICKKLMHIFCYKYKGAIYTAQYNNHTNTIIQEKQIWQQAYQR